MFYLRCFAGFWIHLLLEYLHAPHFFLHSSSTCKNCVANDWCDQGNKWYSKQNPTYGKQSPKQCFRVAITIPGNNRSYIFRNYLLGFPDINFRLNHNYFTSIANILRHLNEHLNWTTRKMIWSFAVFKSTVLDKHCFFKLGKHIYCKLLEHSTI